MKWISDDRWHILVAVTCAFRWPHLRFKKVEKYQTSEWTRLFLLLFWCVFIEWDPVPGGPKEFPQQDTHRALKLIINFLTYQNVGGVVLVNDEKACLSYWRSWQVLEWEFCFNMSENISSTFCLCFPRQRSVETRWWAAGGSRQTSGWLPASCFVLCFQVLVVTLTIRWGRFRQQATEKSSWRSLWPDSSCSTWNKVTRNYLSF